MVPGVIRVLYWEGGLGVLWQVYLQTVSCAFWEGHWDRVAVELFSFYMPGVSHGKTYRWQEPYLLDWWDLQESKRAGVFGDRHYNI